MMISEEEISQVREVVALLPEAYVVEDVMRLGGMTNKVFHVKTDKSPLCVRIPGAGTEAYISRANERRAALESARVGVSAQVLLFDENSGVSITEYLDGVVTMSPELFASRPGAPDRAGYALSKLHSSGAVFANRFDVFALIDDYTAVLKQKNASVLDGYADAVASAGEARQALEAHPVPLVACHCDPLCENFLDTGERMWIVDWEYSGLNDPMWDLGDVIVEAHMSPEHESAMVRAYFGREPTAAEAGRVVIYKALCDLVWTLWGLIQHADNNPADDFWAYATTRFERCKALMTTPQFSQAVVAVSAD